MQDFVARDAHIGQQVDFVVHQQIQRPEFGLPSALFGQYQPQALGPDLKGAGS